MMILWGKNEGQDAVKRQDAYSPKRAAGSCMFGVSAYGSPGVGTTPKISKA
jgi:hypothetical protein